ncbi:hypothetical protein HPB52_024947 [Rhipicephalus sanguineus]|uniref:Uncharacterized protein n=1 Tax=Rhipicephalus sanguineus TaxID=34632 RepID=A0A9D4PAP8_RHISA|nr:hypothetical protein HPB52_024947 [Rhipicephalus sanguineus]
MPPLVRGREEEDFRTLEQQVGPRLSVQQWQNVGRGGYRPVAALNLSRVDCGRTRATSYARRRRCLRSRSRPAGEWAVSRSAEPGKLRSAGPDYRCSRTWPSTGLAIHHAAKRPPQRLPWWFTNPAASHRMRHGDTSEHLDDSDV